MLASRADPQSVVVRDYLSQAALALPHAGGRPHDPDLDYWVTICRKILQRGVRPPLSARVDDELPPWTEDPVAPAELLEAVSASHQSSDADRSYELHPQWEQPFWAKSLRVAPAASAWLIPQAPLEPLVSGELDPAIGRRWVDFLYAPPGRRPVVFEIDGDHHHPRRADADRARDRQLGEVGIRVIRASGTDSLDTAGALLKHLLADEVRVGGAGHRGALRPLLAASAPPRLALAVVEAVHLGLLAKGGPWSIEVEDPDGVAEAVAGPALDPLRAISELWRLGVVPRSIQVNGRSWRLSGETAEGDEPSRRIPPTVRVRLEPTTPYYAPLSAAADLPEITIRPAGVPASLTWLPSETTQRRKMRATEDTDLHLQLLVQDLFGHPGFRDGQLPSLRQALRGGDSVVLLPTGSGKSLIYQLAGLLQPGTTLVVDPLVSLIDDQEARLFRDGIDRVAAVHASRAGGSRERDLALDSVARGEPLFLFLTPERLQSQRFRDHLRESARGQLINLAVIDEAHTVSEWGHDFRTSYLRLARNVRRLCRDDQGGWPPVLAMTGTAGPAVIKDVLRELEIDAEADGALQRPKSHDRPNLHYVKLTGDEQGWQELVRDALTRVVPESLGVELGALAECRGEETLSGIVFTPWAGGAHGVERVRDDLVDVFASAGVTLLAAVYSGKSDRVTDRRAWAGQRAQTAEDFKENRVPLLVATKAFGMGIDKPNIRYTVHAGFPSSIEAFAQEAGRAGRDGREAFCVLTAALPDDKAAQLLLERGIATEERRRRVDQIRRDQSGDLGRQLWFYGNSFPGATEEADLGLKLFGWLMDRGGGPGRQAVIAIHPRRDEKPQDHERRKGRYDRALFRLAMLGIVDDLTIDGPEITVHLADYDVATVNQALLTYLSRIEPGNEATHKAIVGGAPRQLEDRIAAHLRTMAEAVYSIVALARLTAIENMYELANGADDPEHLRRRINAYLGDGLAATILADGVAMSPIDIPRFMMMLERIPAAEMETLSAAAARVREAYPEHPLVWLATAYGTAREPDGDGTRFIQALDHSLGSLDTYQVARAEAAQGLTWLINRLRTDNGGRRWDWAADAFEAWDAAEFGVEYLEDAENMALALAGEGHYRERELAAVVRRRLRRRGREAAMLADHYAAMPHPDERSPE
jgi:ATP-dependent DNA helicase RecQ